MKFYISNPELDHQIEDILRKIRLSMNGIASDHMKQHGISYKKNYGVSIPRLREIASGYTPNNDLAQRLWLLEVRETMILATILQPADKFTFEMAKKWSEKLNQLEIIELTSMNLFSKLDWANLICLNWIESDNQWLRIAAFILAARIYVQLDQTDIYKIIERGKEMSFNAEFQLYKSIAICFSRFCRKNQQIATFVLAEISPFFDSDCTGQQYIFNEVKSELLFLEIK